MYETNFTFDWVSISHNFKPSNSRRSMMYHEKVPGYHAKNYNIASSYIQQL